MIPAADLTAFGAHRPNSFVGAMLALTRRLPANRLGLRLSMPLRRLAINALDGAPVDTEIWSQRLRLYPGANGCEKNALFTPQLFDRFELDVIAAAVDASVKAGRPFVFVDLGANVGLYSLFVASRAGEAARILSIEPQPGIVDRLTYNVGLNSGARITILRAAIADAEGEMELVIDPRDSGGTHLNKSGVAASDANAVRVPCRPLLAALDQAEILEIDALKVDIEGAEDIALAPFFRDAPQARLPKLLLIEDRPEDWSVDLYDLLRERGYLLEQRLRQNCVFRRPG